jgi:hypothetical protein
MHFSTVIAVELESPRSIRAVDPPEDESKKQPMLLKVPTFWTRVGVGSAEDELVVVEEVTGGSSMPVGTTLRAFVKHGSSGAPLTIRTPKPHLVLPGTATEPH